MARLSTEEMRAFCGHNPFEFLVFIDQNGAFAAPDDSEGDISVEKGGLGTIGVKDLNKRQPFGEDGLYLLKVFIGGLVDGDAKGVKGPATISRASSRTTMFLLNLLWKTSV